MLNQTKKMVKHLRINNELELCYNKFNNSYKDKYNMKHLIVFHTPQHNEVVEILNKTLLERTKSILSNFGLHR